MFRSGRRRNQSFLPAFLLGLLVVLIQPIFSLQPQPLRSSNSNNSMVSIYGQTSLSFRRSATKRMARADQTKASNPRQRPKELLDSRPVDPQSIPRTRLEEHATQLSEWLNSKHSVMCLTGAGLSTDSGIPDYRGYNGSYRVGHKPILHQQFMDSVPARQRYWGRSIVGWKSFYDTQPNKGHFALAALERKGRLGVSMEDSVDFYDDKDDFLFTSGQRKLTILTQNVDSLHDRAGSKDVLALHGRNNDVICMVCGHRMRRNVYQEQLEDRNIDWLRENVLEDDNHKSQQPTKSRLRPDGDAQLSESADYNDLDLPPCPCCGPEGFYKPDVVFFGDSVPKHRVAISQQAINHSDGILVVGSSLAVHSAFRHVRAAAKLNIPIALLNVGETRAEFESPIGDTLEECVKIMNG